MDAVELFRASGESTDVFYCGKCRKVYLGRDLAARCCLPTPCDKCGVPCEKGWFRCRSCRTADEEERELARFECAEKLEESQWDGPVFCDAFSSHNEGYFGNLGELRDYVADEYLDELEESDLISLPTFVWTCNHRSLPKLSAEDIIYDWTEDFFEDAHDSVKGESELQRALDELWKSNEHLQSWEIDYKRAVLVNLSDNLGGIR